MYLKETVFINVGQMHLAQNRVQLRAFVNTILKYGVP